jgi:hypothetical protein
MPIGAWSVRKSGVLLFPPPRFKIPRGMSTPHGTECPHKQATCGWGQGQVLGEFDRMDPPRSQELSQRISFTSPLVPAELSIKKIIMEGFIFIFNPSSLPRILFNFSNCCISTPLQRSSEPFLSIRKNCLQVCNLLKCILLVSLNL